jgi:5-methylthioadenosine/S-adenosylhomocysteine deaminase
VDHRGDNVVNGLEVGPLQVDHDHVGQSAGLQCSRLHAEVARAEFNFPMSAAITKDEAVAAISVAAVEAVRAGTTAVLDHHYAPTDLASTLAAADTIERVGLRGVVARGIAGSATDVAAERSLAGDVFSLDLDAEFGVMDACLAARPPGGRVEIWPAPINLTYVGQDAVRRSAQFARERGIRWHTHCASSPQDPTICMGRFGSRPVDWLYDEGLLGPGTTLAHMVFLSDREVMRAGETGTGVAYCPVSDQYIGFGVMPLRELRAAGAVVGLAFNGSSGHRQDMFEQMKQAVLLQRIQHQDPTVSGAEEALELATREGARYMGIEAGILEPGRLADIAVVDLDRPNLTPNHRTVASLVYCARGSDVVTTIVGGEIVYEDGRSTRVDEAALMADLRERSRGLVQRAGLEWLTEPWMQGEPAPR